VNISTGDFTRFANDPSAFRRSLIVDVDGFARRFGDVMDEWQREDFAALDPGLMRCNGRSTEPAKMRAYLERPRGHSKTTDLAVTSVYALAFAQRPIRGYVFAADQDQAGLLKAAMETLVRLNPWLKNIIDIQKNVAVNHAPGHPGQGGRLEIFTSDVASSYGILPDLIIADELTHWEGDGSLFHSLISSAAKRENCLFVIISNAGFSGSWQWDVREAARTDDAWIFRRLDGPLASWMSPARLAEQRRMLPPAAYLRLWENVWSSGLGDALSPEDIEAAFNPELQPMEHRESGWLYVGGVDLGLTRDCASTVVLAVPDGHWGKIRLAHHRLWRPQPGKKVDLMEVEAHLLNLDERFGLEQIGFDPWQAELLSARIESNSNRRRRNQRRRLWTKPFMLEVQPTAANLRSQAALVIESFQDGRLEFFDCLPLKRDFIKLRAEEKSYGIRLVSPRDENGHGDSYSAFANALLIAHEANLKRPVTAGIVSDGGQSPWQREQRSFEARQQAAAEEHEALRNFDESKALWCQAAREMGGNGRLGF
jgi:phage terminase large subunit-like protein